MLLVSYFSHKVYMFCNVNLDPYPFLRNEAFMEINNVDKNLLCLQILGNKHRRNSRRVRQRIY